MTAKDSTAEQDHSVLLTMTDVHKAFPRRESPGRREFAGRAHSVHALMGENGAGKSTLLKCLFGIYAKDSGSIRFLGREVDFPVRKKLWKTVFRWCIQN